MREKEHTLDSLVRAYFNGKEASVMVDTGSTVSTLEYDDPTQNRIFKVGKKITYIQSCKDSNDSTESREKDDIEIASVKRYMSLNDTDKVLQEPLSDGDETSASVLNAVETWKRMLEQPGIHGDSCNSIEGNALPNSDHSVKYNDKDIQGIKTYIR